MSRLLSAVLVLALAPTVKAADDPKEIVAKAIKAHGGEEFLTKHKAAQQRDKGKITLPGMAESEYSDESAHMLPDKFKQNFEMEIMGMKFVMNILVVGDKITAEGTVAGQKIDLGDDTRDAFKVVPHLLRVLQFVPLVKDKGYELNLIGEDKVDEKKVVGVRVSAKDQKDVSMFFDKETGLMLKMEYRTTGPGGNEVTETRLVKEYAKGKDGVVYAKKTVVQHDGKTFIESETVEHKYLEKLDDAEFKK
ncbi:MAG TPA: hypothetical protein VMZ71_17990 [Gemmataceae bacterium]|nr:hypothetical protein [Gemmataceae bacterium]